ncbi:hypothetical protein SmJEL517_g02517 [Synchytrium microbalum]|uniref:RecA family profile 1 domain-containing protein n=1 Tax=Synchytrium microbalum TaxID=1806994 RepID=A0A507C1K8_9FUNG|nr:uncharacterized protein SmJEL517_g02517 [Synchytrium microbalum]TPX34997.1 hypothetical protein SmJEL517_g02517 [Synchytrium microbalum]
MIEVGLKVSEGEIRATTYAALERAKFESVNQVLHTSPADLEKKLGIKDWEARELLKNCAEIIYPPCRVMRGSQVRASSSKKCTSGDDKLDTLLNGGFPVGVVTEIFGEAATGKTTLALQLCITAQLPEEEGGLGKGAIWIATEQLFPSTRLYHLVSSFQQRYQSLSGFDPGQFIAVLSLRDVETQQHILLYHLTHVIDKMDAGIVIIDSIASNFRAENTGTGNEALDRSKTLYLIGAQLKKLAQEKGLVVICLNQVTSTPDTPLTPIHNKQSNDTRQNAVRDDAGWLTGPDNKSEFILSLKNTREFTGGPGDNTVPALGLAWSNIVNVRVQLLRGVEEVPIEQQRRSGYNGGTDAVTVLTRTWRRMKVCFAPHLCNGSVQFCITQDGFQGL